MIRIVILFLVVVSAVLVFRHLDVGGWLETWLDARTMATATAGDEDEEAAAAPTRGNPLGILVVAGVLLVAALIGFLGLQAYRNSDLGIGRAVHRSRRAYLRRCRREANLSPRA